MIENFERAMDFIFRWEGGISDNPSDPGGLTILGLASRYHAEEVAQMSRVSMAEARKIAKKVYRREYWDRCGCDDLPFPLDVIVMDTAVNMGEYPARKLLERSSCWRDYLFRRIERYSELGRARPEFLRGWINRVLDLYRTVKVCTGAPAGHPLSTELG
ncbi:MAG: glycosyl hydrolase 108 family protein [Thermodesulfobacteriota bacterium]